MKLYGKTLVSNIPEPTTNLLIKLCSNYSRKGEEMAAASLSPDKRLKGMNEGEGKEREEEKKESNTNNSFTLIVFEIIVSFFFY
jgi:hypothetical protein